jgi:hypothetical protein
VASPLGHYVFYFELFMLVLNADFTDFKSAVSADFTIRAYPSSYRVRSTHFPP